MTREAHLESTVRAWLGVPTSELTSVPALPDELARRLLRLEEYERDHRDQWGCWEYSFCESFLEGRLWEPDIDRWVAERRRELPADVVREPLWPEGRPFAICVTHDVDLVSYASTPSQLVRSIRSSFGAPRDNPAVTLARPPVRVARAVRRGIVRTPSTQELELCIQIERDLGVPATYFFTVFPSRHASRYDCTYMPTDRCRFRGRTMHVADILVTLADEGFDVGLHGSYPSAVEQDVLSHEKTVLERATGLDVRTTRQHFIHWDVRRTSHFQAAAGITADSSLGFNRNLGFRAGTSFPFRHFDVEREQRVDVLEVPLVIPDTPLMRSDGLELDVAQARVAMQLLIDRVADVGGVATILFHPNNLAHPDFLGLYRWSLEYGLERGGWFASLRQLDRWWREREARLVAP